MEKARFSIIGLLCLLILGSCQLANDQPGLEEFTAGQDNLAYWNGAKNLSPIKIASFQQGQANLLITDNILKSFFSPISQATIQSIALMEDQSQWYLNGYDGNENLYLMLAPDKKGEYLYLTTLFIKCTGTSCTSCLLINNDCICGLTGSCNKSAGIISEFGN